MVGSVSTEMNGRPRRDRRVSAALVLAICSREISASCMRAPPEAEKQTSGMLCSMAVLTARTNFSPTTDPMEPPMKRNSKAAATSSTPLTVPLITISASFSPVAFWAAARRSLYFL